MFSDSRQGLSVWVLFLESESASREATHGNVLSFGVKCAAFGDLTGVASTCGTYFTTKL